MKSKEMYYSRGGQTAHVFHCPAEDGRVFKSTLALKHTLRVLKHKDGSYCHSLFSDLSCCVSQFNSGVSNLIPE